MEERSAQERPDIIRNRRGLQGPLGHIVRRLAAPGLGEVPAHIEIVTDAREGSGDVPHAGATRAPAKRIPDFVSNMSPRLGSNHVDARRLQSSPVDSSAPAKRLTNNELQRKACAIASYGFPSNRVRFPPPLQSIMAGNLFSSWGLPVSCSALAIFLGTSVGRFAIAGSNPLRDPASLLLRKRLPRLPVFCALQGEEGNGPTSLLICPVGRVAARSLKGASS